MKKVVLSIKQFFNFVFGKKAKEQKLYTHTDVNENAVATKTILPDEKGTFGKHTHSNERLIKKHVDAYKKECEEKKAPVPVKVEKSIPIRLNFKQAWMLQYVTDKTADGSWVGPSKVGREWGIQVKLKKGYNSGHSRKVLLDLVEMGRLVKNKDGQYRCK